MNRRLVAIQMFDERLDPARELKDVMAILALVGELDPDARIQERQLTKTLRQRVVVEVDVREDRRARLEADRCSGSVCLSDHSQGCHRVAEMIGLLVKLAVAMNRENQRLR